MATESMFGPNPYDVRQQRQAQDAAYADKLAQATPYQKADMMLGRGAAGLGRIVGGAMGLVDPVEEEAKATQTMQSQIDHSTIEGLRKGAEMFRQSNPRLSYQYMQAAESLLDKESKRKAEAARAVPRVRMGVPATEKEAALMARARQAAIVEGTNANLVGDDLDDHIAKRVNEAQALYRSSMGTQPPAASPPPANVMRQPNTPGQPVETMQSQQVPAERMPVQSPVGQGQIALSSSVNINLSEPFTREQKAALVKDLLARGEDEAAAKAMTLPVTLPVKSKLEMIDEAAKFREKHKPLEGRGTESFIGPDGTPIFGSKVAAAGKAPAALDPTLKKDLAVATASGAVAGKSKEEAKISLPQVINDAEQAIALIDQMIGSSDGKIKPHPGFSSYVGATYAPGLRFVEGTDTASYKALEDQIKGGAFLDAFDKLKGGGSITETEGIKATAAKNRMNKAQSEKEYRKAAREYQTALRAGVKRERAKAVGNTEAAPDSWRSDGYEYRKLPSGEVQRRKL